jgi:predicted RNA binding protein YcfA (HicA-like mRNA interferase family)
MPKLPQVSGDKVIKLLTSLNYSVIRQRGSHVVLKKLTPLGEHNITVPLHKAIAKGTLNDIITRVSLWNNITKQDLIKKL